MIVPLVGIASYPYSSIMSSTNHQIFPWSFSNGDSRSKAFFSDKARKMFHTRQDNILDHKESSYNQSVINASKSTNSPTTGMNVMRGDNCTSISSLDRGTYNAIEYNGHRITSLSGSEDRPPIPERIFVPTSFPLQKKMTNDNNKIPPSIHGHSWRYYCETVGNPSLKIHRFRLPSQLLSTLDFIVNECETYAQSLPNGWHTDLYSLTKQDIALREIPHIYDATLPIVSYMKKATTMVYGTSNLRMDRNQPHVLKYKWEKDGKGHTGVQLHHDKCDYTINLMMSRSIDYDGGGTFFPDAHRLVRLEFGEFLIHPGSCVHGGAPITRGCRYLMVLFANKKH